MKGDPHASKSTFQLVTILWVLLLVALFGAPLLAGISRLMGWL